MEHILQIKNLSVGYGDSKLAVNHLNLDIPKGSIIAIVGESGSGKSTVLRAIMDLLPSNGRIVEGDILFQEKSVITMSMKEKMKLRGEKISLIFQDANSSLNPRRKIGSQYIEVLQAHYSISKLEANRLAVDMLRQIAIPNPERVMKSYPFQLSGGMIQRITIAMAISLHSELLLADEPTSALDVTIQAQVVNMLLDMHKEYGTTMLIVTHNLGVAAYMADYIAVMQHGKLIEFNTRDHIINSPSESYTKLLLESVADMEVGDFE